MTRLSTVPLLSCIALAAIFLVLSCASSDPAGRLTVKVPEGVSGFLHIQTCTSGAPLSEITVDRQGFGSTSICPSGNTAVEIVVTRGTESCTLATPDVVVERTGDGIATRIIAKLRP